jgi:hypothetical protein
VGAMDDLAGIPRLRPLQLLALVCFLALLAGLLFDGKTTILDRDLWWHLKVGDWILANHAVPHSGIFSRAGGTRPWVAYSWLSEILFSRIYAWFGLRGLALLGVLLTLAAASLLFWVLSWLSGRFWVAWVVSLAASFAFLFSLAPPRPVFFSMIFFIVVLTLLLQAQGSGRLQLLYWLPFIFALWVNLHIQFVYGLGVVGLFMGVNALQHLTRSTGIEAYSVQPPVLPLPGLIKIFLACVLACCIGPYSYHPYLVVIKYVRSRVPYLWIREFQAYDFNNFTHYILLLLMAAAFFAVGWRKKLDLFKLSLLIVASLIAFRTRRDAWFLAISAAVVIADFHSEGSQRNSALKTIEIVVVACVLAIVMLLAARNFGFTTNDLESVIRQNYPVDAVNFLRQNPVPGPLYNNLGWGGFLIWYMPQYPVVIDGRTDLYGDELILRAMKTEETRSYTSDPNLNKAGFVLLSKNVPLAHFLATDPRFRIIYQDQISMVFVRAGQL